MWKANFSTGRCHPPGPEESCRFFPTWHNLWPGKLVCINFHIPIFFRRNFVNHPFKKKNPVFNSPINKKKTFRTPPPLQPAYNMGPTETKNRLDNDIEIPEEYSTLVLAAYHQYKNQ